MNYTFGAELELPDIDTNVLIPESVGSYNLREDYVMNSNGIAADCKKRLITIGSEVNLTPKDSIEETMQSIGWLYDNLNTKTNHFAALHIHIGLDESVRNDLTLLKRLVGYTFSNDSYLAHRFVSPPPPTTENMAEWCKQIQKWRKKTYAMSYKKKIMAAESVEEMGNAYQPMKDGRRLRHLVSRTGVNTRSIWDRGTIEFRFFSGTDNLEEYEDTFLFCLEYVQNALSERKPIESLLDSKQWKIPQIPTYNEVLQEGMMQTCLQLNKRTDVKSIIWDKYLNNEIESDILGPAFSKDLQTIT